MIFCNYPLSVTKIIFLNIYRGYPLELIPNRFHVIFLLLKSKEKVMIQADLFDGDPDIDAMARLSIIIICKI